MIVYLQQHPDARVIICWTEYVLFTEGTEQIEHWKAALKRTSHNHNKLSKSMRRTRRCLQSSKLILLLWNPSFIATHSYITPKLLGSQLLPIIFNPIHWDVVFSFSTLHTLELWVSVTQKINARFNYAQRTKLGTLGRK